MTGGFSKRLATKAMSSSLSKDSDFVELALRLGPPPRILWLTCGNVTNSHLLRILAEVLPDAMTMLEMGEVVVEIGDRNA